MELSLYLSDEEINPFNSIYENISDLTKLVSDIFFKEVKGEHIQLSNEYSFKLLAINRENDKLLKLIGHQTREKYNV
jgi:hypothetical protein